ncbi:MAG: hypothetical protein ACETWG_01595, partial [Candidatus Neomarinimicrobiota bacterium]
EERALFEPGVALVAETETVSEVIDTIAVVKRAEEAPVEPGTAAPEATEQLEEDLEAGSRKAQILEAEPVLPGSIPSEGEAEPGAGLETAVPEDEEQAEEFEPGTAAIEREGLDEAGLAIEEKAEEPTWPGEVPATEAEKRERETLDKETLKEKDLAEESVLPGEEVVREKVELEAGSITRVRKEDKDLEREPFEPGELAAAAEEAEPEAEPETQPVAGEAKAAEPYHPDVVSLEKEAEQEREVLDRAAHDGEDLAGERFGPSITAPQVERPPETSLERETPTAEEWGPEEEELAVEAAEAAAGRGPLWIDPQLATFTLATIYKVQGLYQQALQVLDMLEAKGADAERIQAEREAITQLMATGTQSD